MSLFKMVKVCYVTAFLDIDREKWDVFEHRSVDTYIEYFSRQLSLFKSSKDHEMFVYLDEKLVDKIKAKLDETYSVSVIPINEEWLRTHSLLWRRLPRETEIMKSNWYRTVVKHRLEYFEHSQPKYTMINNAKIDLIEHTMLLTDAEVLGWVDFGYIKLPEIKPDRLVDPKRLDLNKMNFSLIDHIREDDYDIMKTLTAPREIIEGGFYFSTRPVLLEYRKLFHEIHQMFHDMNIVDDDQHLLLQCYKRKPHLFKLHYQGKWLKSLKYFQIDDKLEVKTNVDIIVELCGGVGNQLFQIATGYALAKRVQGRVKILKKQGYDMRQGNKPDKYFSTLYRKISQINQPTSSSIVQERQWKYYDLIGEAENAKRSGAQNIILRGFFQSEDHFREYREEIQNLFKLEDPISFLGQNPDADKFPELREKHDYCFIGVRRGDYVTYASEHNPCGMVYYNKAMALMNKERYYIASDDVEWCKKNFIGDQYRFFEIKDDLIQLVAMTLFPNYIIGNSSYHWWGSYLSIYPEPNVLAPNLWIGGKDAPFDSYKSVYRKEMIIIPRIVEV